MDTVSKSAKLKKFYEAGGEGGDGELRSQKRQTAAATTGRRRGWQWWAGESEKRIGGLCV